MRMLGHERHRPLEKRGCFLGRFCLGSLNVNIRSPIEKVSNGIDASGIVNIPCERR